MDKIFLLNQLKFTCDRLNAFNINFYVVGALGGYIDCNLDIIRHHEDIDIMVLESDIEKLNDVFKDSNYEFHDNRMYSNKTLNSIGFTDGDEHEVYAKYANSDFHIGFFMYEINSETYSIIEYFKDGNVQKRLIRTLPIKYFSYQYDDCFKEYCGIKLKTVKVECIYKNKQHMNREKDKFDLKVLKEHINNDVLMNMSGKGKYRITKIENVMINK